jgi:long-chain fatty acid transport protein
MTKRTRQLCWAPVGALGLSLVASQSWGAGFQLWEQSASGLGTAFASTAAAEDASTVWWNPAGMTRLPGINVSVAGHAIKPKAEFSNQGSTFANAPFAGLPVSGGNGGDAGGVAFVPNFYYAHQLTDRLHLGFGLGAPFGLKTEYDDGWVGRYHALKSDLATINLNPSIAFKVNDVVSLGGGLNILRADAELSSAINFGAIGASAAQGALANPAIPGPVRAQVGALLPGLNQTRDGTITVKGDDWGYGFNLGALFQVAPSTRLGVTYRSEIEVNLDGNASYSIPSFTDIPAVGAAVDAGLRAQFRNTGASAKATLPAFAAINVYTQINDRWAVMADLSWTQWSSFDELRVKFKDPTGPAQADAVTTQKWDDSYKIAVGATFKPGERWTLRAGVAYDQSPVSDEFRTPRIPDSDRIWLSLGANVKVGGAGSIDVGFTHVFVDDPTLDRVSEENTAALRTTLRGKYAADVNILSVQYNHRF